MKIGVLSDTHIPDKAAKIPDKVINALKKMDMIIHVGDFGSAGVLNNLKKICPDVQAVYGNMDPYELKKTLLEKEILQIGNFSIGLTHGFGPPQNLIKYLTELFRNDKVDVIIFGHSHNPFNEKVGEILFFNPGSPTDTIFAPYRSYGMIEITDKIEARIIKI